MNNDKSPAEVAAAIIAMRGNTPTKVKPKSAETRRKIEDILIDKRVDAGDVIGAGVFMHETAAKPQVNFSKGSRQVNSLAGVW